MHLVSGERVFAFEVRLPSILNKGEIHHCSFPPSQHSHTTPWYVSFTLRGDNLGVMGQPLVVHFSFVEGVRLRCLTVTGLLV